MHKPYCKPGESESHIALAWAIATALAFLLLLAFGAVIAFS